MREIVLDTETTGLSPQSGDRIVEIGCIELINHMPSGNFYHQYVNPERDMPAGAFDIHGLSEEFLSDKPVFAEIAEAFGEFIADSELIIHNAPFDMAFLNHELGLIKIAPLTKDRVLDTLALAKKKHPGGQNSLDALCRRYGVDNTAREKHGALLDSELLAEVYLELIGGAQPHLTLVETSDTQDFSQSQTMQTKPRPRALASRLSEEDKRRHQKFIEEAVTKPLWKKYSD